MATNKKSQNTKTITKIRKAIEDSNLNLAFIITRNRYRPELIKTMIVSYVNDNLHVRAVPHSKTQVAWGSTYNLETKIHLDTTYSGSLDCYDNIIVDILPINIDADLNDFFLPKDYYEKLSSSNIEKIWKAYDRAGILDKII